MAAYQFGMGGSVQWGISPVVNICVKNWDATFDYGVQDLTTTCSAGYRDLGTGIKSCDISFTGFYDPFSVAAIMTEFQTGAILTMQFNLGVSGSFISGQWLVKSLKWTNPATEYITFECTVGSTGIITTSEA